MLADCMGHNIFAQSLWLLICRRSISCYLMSWNGHASDQLFSCGLLAQQDLDWKAALAASCLTQCECDHASCEQCATHEAWQPGHKASIEVHETHYRSAFDHESNLFPRSEPCLRRPAKLARSARYLIWLHLLSISQAQLYILGAQARPSQQDIHTVSAWAKVSRQALRSALARAPVFVPASWQLPQRWTASPRLWWMLAMASPARHRPDQSNVACTCWTGRPQGRAALPH